MKHRVKTIRRVLRRDRRVKITQMDSNGNQQSLEFSDSEVQNEFEEVYVSSDPVESLEVEHAETPSCAPSESQPVERTDSSLPKKGFWRDLWEKIESNLIWDLIKILLSVIITWLCLIFPQLKTATLEKAAVSAYDYMAKVLADIHVVLSSLI